MNTAVDYQAIEPHLERLAAGGEGIVYRITNMPTHVFKEYKQLQQTALNINALQDLMKVPTRLGASDRQRLETRTAWPERVVVRNGRVVGFLMRTIPDAFYRRHGIHHSPRRVLLDWNQLIYQSQVLPATMVSEVPRLSHEQIITLLADLAKTMALLHDQDFVIGDISGKNLIWRTEPFEVLLIDCDSFRPEMGRGVCVHKESPGWIDMSLGGSPTTKDSDVFKLGVAAYRALWQDPNSVVVTDLVRPLSGSVPPAVIDLIDRSAGPTNRPTARQWVETLGNLYKYGGRPTINVPRSAPTAAPPIDPTPKPAGDPASQPAGDPASQPAAPARQRPRLRVQR